jgi:hypothetical protein
LCTGEGGKDEREYEVLHYKRVYEVGKVEGVGDELRTEGGKL